MIEAIYEASRRFIYTRRHNMRRQKTKSQGNHHHGRAPQFGQGIVEYVIILMFVGIAIVAIIQVLEPMIRDTFSRMVEQAALAPPSLSGFTPPPTPLPTSTTDPSITPSVTPTATDTPIPTDTPLVSSTPTNTPTPTDTSTPTITATPPFASCEYQEAGGLVVIEAENFASQTAGTGAGANNVWFATQGYSGYTANGAMIALANSGDNMGLTQNGPILNYSIRINTAGNYYMYVRGRAENGGADDSVHAGFNNNAITLSGTGFTGFNTAFAWRMWSAPVNLSPGQHTFNVWMREDGMIVDRVMLSTSSSVAANGSAVTGPATSAAPGGCAGAQPPTVTPTPSPVCAPTGALYAEVNFQPTSASVPTGYLVDGGQTFGSRGNGFTYGWNANNTGNTRDRNNGLSPDQRYDTLNHMQLGSAYFWEIAAPNGVYEACLTAGDPSYTNSTHVINVEGVTAVNFTPTNSNRWDEGFVTVTVNDGRITVNNGAGSSNNKINFIRLFTLSLATATPTPTPTDTPIPTDTPSAMGDILFVVGNTSLNSGDTAVYNQLLSLGYTVTVIDDSASTTSNSIGKALVLISSTVGSSNVNNKFRNVTVPVMLWEQALQDDMRMVSGNNRGTDNNETQINIVNSSHPLAAGLSSGLVTVVTSNRTFSYGEPNNNAIGIATIDNNSNRYVIYGYDTGAGMYNNLNAPARRLMFFLEDTTAANLNTDGWALFDAAINWVTN